MILVEGVEEKRRNRKFNRKLYNQFFNQIHKTVEKYHKANRFIQETDIPSLDLLVNEVFIKRTS